MKRKFLHYNCGVCGKKVHKIGLCSDCSLTPVSLRQEIKNRRNWNKRYMD